MTKFLMGVKVVIRLIKKGYMFKKTPSELNFVLNERLDLMRQKRDMFAHLSYLVFHKTKYRFKMLLQAAKTRNMQNFIDRSRK